MSRAPWLEDHDEFSGVGAHELNLRYDHVDGGWFRNRWDGRSKASIEVPQLFMARALVAGATPPRLDGHDGAHYQFDHAPVDWDDLARAVWWLAWKATQSTSYVDPTYDDVVAEAHRFALFFAYHWLSSTTSPATQARHYLEATEGPGRPPGAMLDAEEKGITVDKCLEWCETVETERRRPSTIYTGAYVAGGTIWQSTALRTSKYGLRPMEVAAYTTEARMRTLPGIAAYPPDAWQFSSSGPVPGITGRADMNQIYNRPAYNLAAGVTTVPQPVPENDMGAIRLMIPTDDPNGAQFFAECFGPLDPTGQPGVALSCRWTGDGSDQTVVASIAAHKGAGMTDYRVKVVDFKNIALDGPLPPGWTPERFRNPAEIRARDHAAAPADLEPRVDTLEAVTAKLNDSVGRVGQDIHEVRVGLGKLAPN